MSFFPNLPRFGNRPAKDCTLSVHRFLQKICARYEKELDCGARAGISLLFLRPGVLEAPQWRRGGDGINYPEPDEKLRSPKPHTWREKPMGQWCRNVSANVHVQCPRASYAFQYDCCGETMAECCFALMGWVYLLLGCIVVVGISTLTFHLLLHFNLLWPIEKKIELRRMTIIEEKPRLINA
ncbi:unnamed protein product, partial [Mesorhabditis spiculigera]